MSGLTMRLLYRNEISGIHRICNYTKNREGNVPCFNCVNKSKCTADILLKLTAYEELGYSPEELALLIETHVPYHERERIRKRNVLINTVYDKLYNLTDEQMLDIVFEQYDEYCNVCVIRTRCSGTSSGPNGPIFPPCADGFGSKLIDKEALYNEVEEILMEKEEEN